MKKKILFYMCTVMAMDVCVFAMDDDAQMVRVSKKAMRTKSAEELAIGRAFRKDRAASLEKIKRERSVQQAGAHQLKLMLADSLKADTPHTSPHTSPQASPTRRHSVSEIAVSHG